jgi:hypothetical protein
MTIKSIYGKYFQKSKIFLYPQLGFKRGLLHKPFQTYLFWDGDTEPGFRFYCHYKNYNTDAFRKFESEVLGPHARCVDYHVLEDDTILYCFDFTKEARDIKMVIDGRYSRLSEPFKKNILTFFGEDNVTEYIESYLYPEYYFDESATILDVDQESLKIVGELCDKPDIEKETLICKTKNITA